MSTAAVRVYINGVVQSQPLVGDGPAFRKRITENGCFTLGQEPDAFCGGFNEFQAFDGLLDEM